MLEEINEKTEGRVKFIRSLRHVLNALSKMRTQVFIYFVIYLFVKK